MASGSCPSQRTLAMMLSMYSCFSADGFVSSKRSTHHPLLLRARLKLKAAAAGWTCARVRVCVHVCVCVRERDCSHRVEGERVGACVSVRAREEQRAQDAREHTPFAWPRWR